MPTYYCHKFAPPTQPSPPEFSPQKKKRKRRKIQHHPCQDHKWREGWLKINWTSMTTEHLKLGSGEISASLQTNLRFFSAGLKSLQSNSILQAAANIPTHNLTAFEVSKVAFVDIYEWTAPDVVSSWFSLVTWVLVWIVLDKLIWCPFRSTLLTFLRKWCSLLYGHWGGIVYDSLGFFSRAKWRHTNHGISPLPKTTRKSDLNFFKELFIRYPH